nr:MAG TPA: hypothetical protein [Caudoviricetes sp.]
MCAWKYSQEVGKVFAGSCKTFPIKLGKDIKSVAPKSWLY